MKVETPIYLFVDQLIKKNVYIYIYTWRSQMFYNILVHTSFRQVYHVTKK